MLLLSILDTLTKCTRVNKHAAENASENLSKQNTRGSIGVKPILRNIRFELDGLEYESVRLNKNKHIQIQHKDSAGQFIKAKTTKLKPILRNIRFVPMDFTMNENDRFETHIASFIFAQMHFV